MSSAVINDSYYRYQLDSVIPLFYMETHSQKVTPAKNFSEKRFF